LVRRPRPETLGGTRAAIARQRLASEADNLEAGSASNLGTVGRPWMVPKSNRRFPARRHETADEYLCLPIHVSMMAQPWENSAFRVAVGFIALAGVAAETGVVMLIYLKEARAASVP
jgi:hypothetical protein